MSAIRSWSGVQSQAIPIIPLLDVNNFPEYQLQAGFLWDCDAMRQNKATS